LRLIDRMMEDCVFLNHLRIPDGRGGYKEVWQDGAEFSATIIKNSTTEATIAERQGIKEIYTVVVNTGVELDYHDAFRRKKDGATFRVTSMIKDSEAPDASTVKISKVTAERWELPDG